MSRRSGALSNDPAALEAADAALLDGASALGAVLAGYFVAAGSRAGVLLSPLSLLVGGVGSGARAYDGRLRQPGVGARRPRGFQPGEQIPVAARLAVPVAIDALLVAHAYAGGGALAPRVRPGERAAAKAGSPARAALLERVRAVGAAALTESSFVRPMLHAGGAPLGGALTEADFEAEGPFDADPVRRGGGDDAVLEAPWADAALGAVDGAGYVVCAADVRGSLAALHYRCVDAGVHVPELDLIAPLAAVPVQRGVPRVTPGSVLPAPAPIALSRVDGEERVLAAPGAERLELSDGTSPLGLARRRDKTVRVWGI